MKCPVCFKKGLKSCVYIGSTTSTLMYSQPYYDEEGNFHENDPNTHTTNYSCSNGHRWTISSCRGEERIIIDQIDDNLSDVLNDFQQASGEEYADSL